jgi:uncharacterized protein YbbK (DUF523 family)
MERIIVSACLLGMRTRYDGGSKTRAGLVEKLRDACVIPVCPEQLGGLPTPRPRSFIERGDASDVLEGRSRVITGEGADVTEQFVRGAREAARLAEMLGVTTAYLKSNSPSCGFGVTHGPEGKVPGNGVLAELLARMGVRVITVE